MLIIQHRVNTLAQLQTVSAVYGVETDLRPGNEGIIHHHDPFCEGPLLNDYLQHYQHRFCIANIKSEGIEESVIQQLEARNITDYFLLDVSLPFMVKLSNKGIKNLAVRFSEFEPVELAARFAGRVNWVWVDCFTQLPLNAGNYAFLSEHFRICLVSPELQGRSADEIAQYRAQLHNMPVQAVCTKHPELWLS